MIFYLKNLWKKYNPFDIQSQTEIIVNRFTKIEHRLNEIDHHLDNKLTKIEEEADQRRIILNSIGDAIPDMIWAKDVDGRYMYVNTSIKEHLLLMHNPIGMTDLDISKINKSKYGEEYTFGQQCANSDEETLHRGHAMRFLEHGKVKGRMLYLEVFKNVMRDDGGNVIGTCGVGRDMTEYVLAYRDKSDMRDIFKRYEFDDRSYRE